MKLKAAIRKWRNQESYKKQSSIHWFVWLIENPNRPVSLTGAVDLYNHDIIHILLDRNMDVRDEAMVIGFTMGNSETTSSWVRWLFEFCAKYFYPIGYRFDEKDLIEYERGFAYGYSRPKRNIHTENFVTSKHVGSIRREWSIKTSEVL